MLYVCTYICTYVPAAHQSIQAHGCTQPRHGKIPALYSLWTLVFLLQISKAKMPPLVTVPGRIGRETTLEKEEEAEELPSFYFSLN